MKKSILVLGVAAIALLASCSKSTSTDTAEAGEAAAATDSSVTYQVDAAASSVQRVGAKLRETKHTGTIAIKEGNLSATNGVLTAGKFVMDMSSITEINNADQVSAAKLSGHLQSADFFDVANHPTSTFEVVGVEAGKIKGNLTIKGITKLIEIPATVTITEQGLEATSQFTINRNDWGVTWGSAANPIAFLKDNLVKEEVEYNVRLVATK